MRYPRHAGTGEGAARGDGGDGRQPPAPQPGFPLWRAAGSTRRSSGAQMNTTIDPVKQQVAAHWDRRAAHFDDDFGHSIATPAERDAWDRILDLVVPQGPLDAVDAGCATGFLSLELAAPRPRGFGGGVSPSHVRP